MDRDFEILVMCLYVYMPPRRIQDYYLMKFRKTYNTRLSKEFNYCVINKNSVRLVFNKHKTAGLSENSTIINLTHPDKNIPRPFSTLMKRLALIL